MFGCVVGVAGEYAAKKTGVDDFIACLDLCSDWIPNYNPIKTVQSIMEG